jgi:methionyl-tRNA synthetase
LFAFKNNLFWEQLLLPFSIYLEVFIIMENERLNHRPEFPKRAIVTGGMPYGNKQLHLGHVGGMFVHADTFARFLRDRIGKENVIFISGTDCYGSPILEGYRKLVESGEFKGTIKDYVMGNHIKQEETLKKYGISLNFFGASALDPAGPIHNETSKDVIEKLYDAKSISKLSTLQFYDPKAKTFLNGRQVVGKCPIEGCTSERGYADECSLGHQYMPIELIDPISTLSGEKPELRKIENWYFNLENYSDLIKKWLDDIEKNHNNREFMTKEIREFLKKPEIYIKRDQLEEFDKIKDKLPKFNVVEDNANKSSITIVFDKLNDREDACEILTDNGVRYRTGKTLVPFRLTGNIEWGVPTPTIENMSGLTFWVWPESLWAPISFTKTYLKETNDKRTYKDFWCSKDAKVYQFIGEDNIYFYGPAELSIFMAMQGQNCTYPAPDGELQMPTIIANKHLLFLNKKASSSSEIKPPMADELLNYYTPEQLRAHFLGAALNNNSASFEPKPFNPNAKEEDIDPTLKEGNLLTNVYNRIVRTIFYTLQQSYDSIVPNGKVSDEILKSSQDTILNYEKLMSDQKFHVALNIMDGYIRKINKYWVKIAKENAEKSEPYTQGIIDTLYMIRVATVLMHPIVPFGTEMIADYLDVNKDKFFDWKYIFDDLYSFFDEKEHKVKFLEPRVDFFKKHPSQLVNGDKDDEE